MSASKEPHQRVVTYKAPKPKGQPAQPKLPEQPKTLEILTPEKMSEIALGWGFPKSKLKESDELLKALFSLDQRVKAREIKRLSDDPDPIWLKLVLHFVKDKSLRVQEASMDTLSVMVEKHEKLKTELKMRPENRELLTQFLEGKTASLITTSMRLLALINDMQSYPEIVKHGKSTNPNIRLTVMEIVAEKELRGEKELLIYWLAHPEWEVRGRAVQIFYEMRLANNSEVDLLFNTYEVETDEYVKNLIKKTMKRMKDKKSPVLTYANSKLSMMN